MTTKMFTLTIEWEVHDRRPNHVGFWTGRSVLNCEAEDYAEAVNHAIRFCNYLPSWEFKSNKIDLEQYREGNSCIFNYRTQLSKIISIEVSK